jgi:hypothetical protein
MTEKGWRRLAKLALLGSGIAKVGECTLAISRVDYEAPGTAEIWVTRTRPRIKGDHVACGPYKASLTLYTKDEWDRWLNG